MRRSLVFLIVLALACIVVGTQWYLLTSQRTDLQAVERDFAFVLDADVEAINVVNAAQGADKVLIEEVLLDAQTEGGFIDADEKVEVVRITGNFVFVRKVKENRS